ncbi:Yop proteins translocation protein U [Candidatus Rubidus massiliensis]|nr:MAG: EscU/YscU/HrcU family type III secretion system export apparatus switch protein [Chlamydia sp. 32-24]CDZ80700.1 Yop proteins translocation protein U [Candidatus Rubidus massiliensis]
MAEKTEKATPKKLRDARKKGQVAKSQDLPSAFTFIFSIWAALALSGWLYQQIGDFTTATFKFISAGNWDVAIPQLFNQSLYVILTTSLPILGIVSFIGVLVTFLSVGPVFAPEVFKFDIKKFNPIQNLKQKFKMKTLVELLKSLFKVGIAAYLIYGVIYNSLPVLIKAASLPMIQALLVFNTFLLEAVIKVGILFIAVAAFDFFYQRKTFNKEMMMEKFEVKQEYKNTEGNPEIKGKRRQVAQEIAYSDGPTSGVRRASAVVTNPTHLAIALAYEREVDAAPYICAMGKEMIAEQIVKLAEKHEIPIIRNIPLAHNLFENGELNEYVPEDTYEAIAEILRWIANLDKQQSGEVNIET